MTPLRIVVLGTLASNPYAGMAWMHMQIAAGLRAIGVDVAVVHPVELLDRAYGHE
jgi:hypothetical protein